MQTTRKIRVRMDELKAMKISEIRKMATQVGICISDFIDKKEIIDKLAASDSVDLIEGVPILDIPEEEWEAIGVKGLRQLLKGYGISDKDALMKSELRNLLLTSGRIRVMPGEVEATPAGAAEASQPPVAVAPTAVPASSSTESSAQFQLGRDLLMNLSIRELKSIMEAYGISSNNCLERQDLIDRMSQDSRISITED